MGRRRKGYSKAQLLLGFLAIATALAYPGILVIAFIAAGVVMLLRFLGSGREDEETGYLNGAQVREVSAGQVYGGAGGRTSDKGAFSRANSLAVFEQRGIDTKTKAALRERFIAFDVETTGLDSVRDRIVEIGAVLFENCEATWEYSTLVKPGIPISPSASRTNHLTDEMVAHAPSEKVALEGLVDILEDAMDGKTLIVAHNAQFDMEFLTEAFARQGITAYLCCIDTCAEARSRIGGLENYKLATVAKHFGIVNRNEHRALGDAEACGEILIKLLDKRRLSRKKAE